MVSRKRKTETNLNEIPLECLVHIFTQLPDEDLIKCRLICKEWTQLLDSLDNTLWRSRYFERYGGDLDGFTCTWKEAVMHQLSPLDESVHIVREHATLDGNLPGLSIYNIDRMSAMNVTLIKTESHLMRYFPNQLSRIRGLKKIDLKRGIMQKLSPNQQPSTIHLLHDLQELNLSENQLTSFPWEILALTNLQILDLSYNNIRGIPQRIDRLSSLKELNMSHNLIRRIPASISSIQTISTLKLNGNPLEKLNLDVLSTPNLSQLVLDRHVWLDVPYSLDKVTTERMKKQMKDRLVQHLTLDHDGRVNVSQSAMDRMLNKEIPELEKRLSFVVKREGKLSVTQIGVIVHPDYEESEEEEEENEEQEEENEEQEEKEEKEEKEEEEEEEEEKEEEEEEKEEQVEVRKRRVKVWDKKTGSLLAVLNGEETKTVKLEWFGRSDIEIFTTGLYHPYQLHVVGRREGRIVLDNEEQLYRPTCKMQKKTNRRKWIDDEAEEGSEEEDGPLSEMEWIELGMYDMQGFIDDGEEEEGEEEEEPEAVFSEDDEGGADVADEDFDRELVSLLEGEATHRVTDDGEVVEISDDGEDLGILKNIGLLVLTRVFFLLWCSNFHFLYSYKQRQITEAMSKRGLSLEEKRSRMRDLFIQTVRILSHFDRAERFHQKGVYLLKEVEKICSKEKGIVLQSVKDVLTSLVNDGMVKTDKIGTSVYFWMFPSDEANNRANAIKKLTTDIEGGKRKRDDLKNSISEATKGREESDERSAKIARLTELEKENAELKKKLALYADNDPGLINAMEKDSENYKLAANRWTDTIWTLKSYCANMGVDGSSFEQNFEIPSNFDYV
ncbi:GAJ protein-like [Planoprotostelium fungivorum]|uniref:GAJ protein-like n=1 Tax=Planoprotostelium fungivorum TaxID=1890364 RepID=A0A2P6NBA4_9EUKA|nr:GAJ protein-like [Planoprotostelium fungivorum]